MSGRFHITTYGYHRPPIRSADPASVPSVGPLRSPLVVEGEGHRSERRERVVDGVGRARCLCGVRRDSLGRGAATEHRRRGAGRLHARERLPGRRSRRDRGDARGGRRSRRRRGARLGGAADECGRRLRAAARGSRRPHAARARRAAPEPRLRGEASDGEGAGPLGGPGEREPPPHRGRRPGKCIGSGDARRDRGAGGRTGGRRGDRPAPLRELPPELRPRRLLPAALPDGGARIGRAGVHDRAPRGAGDRAPRA